MKSSSGFQFGDWKRTVFGIGVGFVLMLVLTGAFAWLMDIEVLSRESMGLASAGVLILSAFLGGLCSGRGDGQIVRCLAVGGGMILLILFMNLLLFGGSLKGLIPEAVMIVGSSAAAGMVGGIPVRGKRRKYRYAKYRNR